MAVFFLIENIIYVVFQWPQSETCCPKTVSLDGKYVFVSLNENYAGLLSAKHFSAKYIHYTVSNLLYDNCIHVCKTIIIQFYMDPSYVVKS